MVITNTGRNTFRDSVKASFTTGGIGLSNTAEVIGDTGLFGGGTTIDSADVVTGWVASGIGSAEVANSTAGEFQEGVGCLNLPTSSASGQAIWSKDTGSSTDLSSTKVVMWFYIDNATELAASADAVQISLSTGGYTNINHYQYVNTLFTNGWTSVVVDVDNPDSTGGSGATETAISHIRLSVRLTAQQATNDMRMDYWRSYTAGTLGVTDSNAALTVSTGNYFFKTVHQITTTESNGLLIVESGDNDGANLLSRQTFASIDKGLNTEIQIDKYYYIE